MGEPGVQIDAAGFCSVVNDMTSSIASVRSVINGLRQQDNLNTTDGISLLSVKHHLLLSYLQSLLLVSSHCAIGHTLTERAPPAEAFSHLDRSQRGTDAGDLVDSMVETRVVLEKVKTLESRLRYQIEKLVRTAQEPEKTTSAVAEGRFLSVSTLMPHAASDPLAFRPNPQNLVDNDGDDSDTSVKDDSAHNVDDGIYRPPRLAPVPYTGGAKSKSRDRRAPVPTALRSLQDPSLPHMETTTGLGTTPSLLSGRANYLKRLEAYEEENFGRVVLGKNKDRQRRRDEEDLALGAELGGARGVGKNRRRGGLEDEFGDVLRSVERGTRVSQMGDGYDELRKSGRKKNAFERAKVNVRAREDGGDDDQEPDRMRKKTRFEQDRRKLQRRTKKK
ncbi:hypothetical protein MIND_01013700 [Mycena indigotica]|uniref:Neuroguidin n=1 Tax=Mycena indigotica TaxID=2126181 RepID=A0A8H6S8E4_9AGAR|nr:uncharacterized protein MIND_01013700 [Mycena indigotica]KAF7294763.1 hypothetical protein MIND_01013700 [Mycena indigotica]